MAFDRQDGHGPGCSPAESREGRPGHLGRAYVTMLSSESYLEGALVLVHSLRKTSPRYPIYVVVGSRVSQEVLPVLRDANVPWIIAPRVDLDLGAISDSNASNKLSHWTNTFEKLSIFSLTMFEKVVFLDSDMLVLRNLDHLFEAPHLSAVQAGRSFPGNSGWTALNSGLMVLEPEPGLSEKLIGSAGNRLYERGGTSSQALSDQDIIQGYWPDWPRESRLHLDEGYNIFFPYVDYYARKMGYGVPGKRPIHVLHFIGLLKPWMRTRDQLLSEIFMQLRRRQLWQALMLSRYAWVLKKAARRTRRSATHRTRALLGSQVGEN